MWKFMNGVSHFCMAPEGGEGGGGGGAPATPAAPAGGEPAAPATPPAGGEPAAPAAPAVSWLPKASDEDVAYVQSKGWDKSQNPAADILNSYRNLEKVFGADKAGNTFVIPGSEAEEGAWDKVYNKLGRPETVDGYTAPQFEGMSEELDKQLRQAAHKAGLTDKQINAMAEWNNEATKAHYQQLEQEAQVQFGQQQEAIRQEWGAAYDQNLQIATEATKKMGWTREQIDAMQMSLGFDGVMKLALDLGKAVGEARFVGADGGRVTGQDNIMTPGQAKLELNKLATDQEFMKSWTDKSHPKHAEAVQRKTQLTKWANPG